MKKSQDRSTPPERLSAALVGRSYKKESLERSAKSSLGRGGDHVYGQGAQDQGFFIGIDPGKYGAAVAIGRELILVHDWQSPEAAKAFFERITRDGQIILTVIEDVNQKRMPYKGRVGAYGLGISTGYWQMLCVCFGIEHRFARPDDWKRATLDPNFARLKNSKERALATARALYPGLIPHLYLKSKHHNRADAALMAHYAKRVWDFESRRI